MNFFARVASLALSPKQLGAFVAQWISEPTKRRAIALAENPSVAAFAASKPGSAIVGLGQKVVNAVKATPAAAGNVSVKVGNLAENTVAPAVLSNAQPIEQITFGQFAAHELVLWGRHFKRAPAEAAELWGKVKTGTLTWSQVGAGTVEAGYIALWGITPYTLISVTLANPALNLSDHETAHH